ncbi:MAG: D-alanyl-D-alanine carboxypeptidase [Micrococcales bacterium]|nr:D-alanyl-D-alanine carboxypeptidase [Micrococcales bacterium]
MTGYRPGRAWVAVACALILPLGYLSLDAIDVVPGVLTSDLGHEDRVPAPPTGSGAPSAEAVSTTEPADTDSGSEQRRPKPAVPGSDAALAAPDPAAPQPTRDGLAAVLGPLLRDPTLGTSVGMEVRDGLTGRVLFGQSAATPRTPASATKVLTAAAIAQVEDLSQRFETRVVVVDADTVALVAGGDNLLAAGEGDPGSVAGQAGLANLARATSAALGPSTRSVRVLLDDRFAAGPTLAPGWARADVALGLTGPVAMLGLSTDRATPYRPAGTDPAMLATSAFAHALEAAGVRVQGQPARAAAPPGATELAVVRSAPVYDVLALALDESDNDLTETVSRWACARGGASTTFAGCAGWLRERIGAAGLDVSSARLVDTSGLSGGTHASAALVAGAVTFGVVPAAPQAGQTAHRQLAQVLAQLPVAGLSGTLQDRFLAPVTRAGVGVVRAKTGTLTGVGSLAGTVVDSQGRLLAFAVLADRVPVGGTSAARLTLDRLAAVLAACGCS